MSDTPRTDAFVKEFSQIEEGGRVWYLSACNALASHARQLERELSDMTKERDELRTKLAERDAALAGCVLIARNVLLALTPDLPNSSRPTFKEFSEAIDSLPATAKRDAEILSAATEHYQEVQRMLGCEYSLWSKGAQYHQAECGICQAVRAKEVG